MGAKKQKIITIECIESEEDVFVFSIDYGGTPLTMDCYLEVAENVLLLRSANIEGPGANIFGRHILVAINGVCKEFCRKYRTKEIIITGSKRTAGKTKGTYLKPIHRKYKTL